MTELKEKTNFLEHIIEKDLADGVVSLVHTRFPPEPNGYLHIGHAKSICLNFGLAEKYQGRCNLRFDDTNPEKEEQHYIDAIEADVRWLGFNWHGDVRHAADYFEQLYLWAEDLTERGLAYVDFSSAEEIRLARGTLTEPGKNSPWREASPEENLAALRKMRAGEFEEGAAVLRAKIDMASANMNLRDPVMYRIRFATHHRSKDQWCIYPSYDYTHGLSDAIEGISHSICTLEFEDHRPLYDWFIAHLDVPAVPRQFEFARLQLNYTVTSKRKLKQLVDAKVVDGWSDPRMPTISGMRRRGVPAEAIRRFCAMIGVTRSDSVVDIGMLEFAIREALNQKSRRAMAVLNPLKVTITNYPESKTEALTAPWHPQDQSLGNRTVVFARELWIDRDDFMVEKPNKKWKRLYLHGEVRLRYGYVIRCDEVIHDAKGEILELRCSYDPGTLGVDPSDRKVKGVIHWLNVATSVKAEVHLYDRLFDVESPDSDSEQDFMTFLNPNSLKVIDNAQVEAFLAQPEADIVTYQFEREGYFCLDHQNSTAEKPVFNRTISLRDTWAKINESHS